VLVLVFPELVRLWGERLDSATARQTQIGVYWEISGMKAFKQS